MLRPLLLVVALLLLGHSNVGAQGHGFGVDPSQVHVRLVTFGPGAEVHQYFGHNALWLHDAGTGQSALYNYGMFSFAPDVVPQYLMGHLRFWVAATDVVRTFEHYKRADRSISIQELNLDGPAKTRIVNHMLAAVEPENRYYMYHHFENNCSTQLRDVLDTVLGGQLRTYLTLPARLTYREHVRRYTQHDSAIHMGALFILNDSVDAAIERWHESFLPLELATAIAGFEYKTSDGTVVPLVTRSYDLFTSSHPGLPERPANDGQSYLWLGVLAGGIALLLGVWLFRAPGRIPSMLFGLFHLALGATFGVAGLVGSLMWAFTEHAISFRNENQFLATGITFLFMPLGVMIMVGSRRGMRWSRAIAYLCAALAMVGLVAKLLPTFDQNNMIPMLTLLPINLGLAAGHAWAARGRASEGAKATGG